MSLIQRFLVSILPRSWGESMEADSRKWMVRCRCGFGRSVWEIGGIRWMAAGQPRWFRRCPKCRKLSWHKVSKEEPTLIEPRE